MVYYIHTYKEGTALSKESKIAKKEAKAAKKAAKAEKKQASQYAKLVKKIDKKNAKAEKKANKKGKPFTPAPIPTQEEAFAGVQQSKGKKVFKLIILIMVILLSILFYRPFCKWICPLGAIYSLFNKISFLSIKIEDEKCVGCHQCTKACKMDVNVIKTPNHPECIRCGACIKACPKDAIHYQFLGKSCEKKDISNRQ